MQKKRNWESYVLFRTKIKASFHRKFYLQVLKTNKKKTPLKNYTLKDQQARQYRNLEIIAVPQRCISATNKILQNLRALRFWIDPVLRTFNMLLCSLKVPKRISIPFLMVILMFQYICLSAQTPRQDSGADGLEPLKIGQQVPDDFWKREHTVLHNGKVTKVSLETLKGKPLILDFWASWCGPCIAKFNELDSLQKKYNKHLNILLVNSQSTQDTPLSILTHWNKTVCSVALPTVVYDTYLTGLFPRYAQPYYVWIDKSGMISVLSNSLLIHDSVIKLIIDK